MCKKLDLKPEYLIPGYGQFKLSQDLIGEVREGVFPTPDIPKPPPLPGPPPDAPEKSATFLDAAEDVRNRRRRAALLGIQQLRASPLAPASRVYTGSNSPLA